MYKKGGKKPKNKSSFMEESKELKFGGMSYKNGGLYSAAEKAENIAKVKKMNSQQSPEHQTNVEKKTGGKSMEPGGGGRFAALVNKLKGKGKSEDSAKAIAASIGRKKYGKSKFQEMASKGKKGLGGMSDSTSANEAGMDMMESMGAMEAMDKGKRKKSKAGSGARHAADVRRRQQQRTKVARKNIGNCRRGPNGQTICD